MTACGMDTLTLSDGYRAAIRWWRPASPRGAVLYFHGIQSHGGWYEQSGSRLAEAGFTVLMPDRRGSGLNREQRGHVASVERCIQDGEDALERLRSESGFDCVHVVGVSWGGKLAVALAARAPARVTTLTLVAPGLFPRIDLTRTEKVLVGLSLVNDRTKMFDIPLNDPRFFTDNPERIAYVERDSLKLTQVSACFLLATRKMDRLVRGFDASGWRGAIHVLLAGHDRIIDNERTRWWLRRLPMADRRITDFPQGHHTLEFEREPAEFLDSLAGWIGER